jgi:phosphosulfolactate phosphohydrolase-like enzyme
MKPVEAFDRFAPASGKSMAMVVTGKEFHISMGTNDIAYVNLGAAQGVTVGDYFRVFRYSGTETELAYQGRRNAFKVYGFGAAPTKYKWDTVPRQVIGEGVVLRTAPNASTVLLTFTLSEIYAGDYVELE